MTDYQRARDVKRLPVRWLWRDRLPEGMLSLIAGRPGQGKSLVAAALAAEISKKGTVIFSNMEDPLAQVVRPRLEAAGANLDNIIFATHIFPDDLDAFEELVVETKAKLAIFDPIAAHLSVSIFNDQEVRRALSPLAAVCSARNLSVVMIGHTLKYVSSKSHPLASIGGSGAGLVGAARAIFLFGPNPDDKDERVLAPVKFNLGPMPKSCVFELDEVEFYNDKDRLDAIVGRLVLTNDQSDVKAIDVILRDPAAPGKKQPEKIANASEWLTLYLAMGPRPAAELREDATQYGHSWSTIKRAADECGVEKSRKGFGAGGSWHWNLPEGHPMLVVQDDDTDDGGIEVVDDA